MDDEEADSADEGIEQKHSGCAESVLQDGETEGEEKRGNPQGADGNRDASAAQVRRKISEMITPKSPE